MQYQLLVRSTPYTTLDNKDLIAAFLFIYLFIGGADPAGVAASRTGVIFPSDQ